ncbi:probable ribonuclease P/MRP protein subunit POP5 isoform X2 [Cucumis melo]|uniref:Probable ribonuclease P/MRP protein subunit POP5 isoform X2 n=1 Tax=Cucumis melo TaxID=3656 RepID=A0ABM3L5B6_CUCME|nr:probable ribonuclease P/MRP protein subunit POP5 isoform X2 [Cucumis melo]
MILLSLPNIMFQKQSRIVFFSTSGNVVLLPHLDLFKYVNPITKLCIIRASREDYQNVWAAITMVRSISNCPVVFNLLDLSGNTRACKNTALRLDGLKFEQYKLMVGHCLPDNVKMQMQNCLEKIANLEN